jgi:colicin import membrane protein
VALEILEARLDLVASEMAAADKVPAEKAALMAGSQQPGLEPTASKPRATATAKAALRPTTLEERSATAEQRVAAEIYRMNAEEALAYLSSDTPREMGVKASVIAASLAIVRPVAEEQAAARKSAFFAEEEAKAAAAAARAKEEAAEAAVAAAICLKWWAPKEAEAFLSSSAPTEAGVSEAVIAEALAIVRKAVARGPSPPIIRSKGLSDEDTKTGAALAAAAVVFAAVLSFDGGAPKPPAMAPIAQQGVHAPAAKKMAEEQTARLASEKQALVAKRAKEVATAKAVATEEKFRLVAEKQALDKALSAKKAGEAAAKMAADAEKRASAEAAKAEVAAAKKAAAAVAKQPERVASSAPTIKPVGQSKVSVQEDLKRLGLKTYK